MNLTIHPRPLEGKIDIIPSKSQAHRLLICAAFADKPTKIICKDTNRDMEATVKCLQALGAAIKYESGTFWVEPAKQIPSCATLPCQDSGSTLRFLLPVVGALGVDGTFLLEGRLPERPLSPLWEEMERMGCTLDRPTKNTLRCTGRLSAGEYQIDGSVSSQFITGLMFATTLIKDHCNINITGKIESKPYIELTKQALSIFSYKCAKRLNSPGTIQVEGDWSNGAFFHAANALGSHCNILGLSVSSLQGDREVINILQKLEEGFASICGKDIPDLIPILSVVASQKHGAHFTNIERLRLKESDRIASTSAMLNALGIKTESTSNSLLVYPGVFKECTVDSFGDHRIAMSAAIAATAAKGSVTILGAECAAKSYPAFWAEYARLGGNYEQHLR